MRLIRVSWCALLVVLTAGCPNWESLRAAPLTPTRQPLPLRAQVVGRGWTVQSPGSKGWPYGYDTDGDPELEARLAEELGGALRNSNTLEIVDAPDHADVIIEVRARVTVSHPGYELKQLLMMFFPVIVFGVPITWATFETEAEFLVLARDADGCFAKIAQHQAYDRQTHYIGLGYGGHNLWTPFDLDLANVFASFQQFLVNRRFRWPVSIRSGQPRG